MSLKQLVVILALLTTVRAAVAQPGQPSDPASGAPMPVAVQPPPQPSALPPPPPAKEPRSTSVGISLAVVGSIVPALAFGVGWSLEDEKKGAQVIAGSVLAGLILPSLGMYYGGKNKTVGQYPRAAAVVTLLVGVLIDGFGDNQNADEWYTATAALYGLGAGIDIVMTPGAVSDWNARNTKPPSMAIAPVAFPSGGVGVAFGGAL